MDRDKIAKELAQLTYPFSNSDDSDYYKVADWIIEEIEKVKKEQKEILDNQYDYNNKKADYNCELCEKLQLQQIEKAEKRARVEVADEIYMCGITGPRTVCFELMNEKCQEIIQSNQNESK